MAGRIEGRDSFTGTGMGTSPEKIEELENRRAQHARLITGKPERTFAEVLETKMRGEKDKRGRGQQQQEQQEDEQEKGAINPHLGLSPGQSPELVQSGKGKGRRSGRVIVKG